MQPKLIMPSEVTGSGEPLVLVPGGLTGWVSWKPHAERLAADYRVIRVQLLTVECGLRGTPLPADYSVLVEKEALRHALDDLGIVEADFVAWSYGALTTLAFALDHPDRVRSLVLIEPPAMWVLRSRSPLSDEHLQVQKVFQSYGPGEVTEDQLEFFAHVVGMVPSGVNPRERPQWPVWVEHRQSLGIGDAVYQHEDDIKRVRSFKQPVLLFKGEGSWQSFHAIIDILGEEFPDARIEMLPRGHAPHIVSMEPFMRTLSAFLGDTGR